MVLTRSPRSEVRTLMDNASRDANRILENTSRYSTTVIFWITITTALFISIPAIVQAFRYSSHKPGGVEDADFWLLLQAGGMQILNLGTSAYAICKDRMFSRFDRNFLLTMTVAGILFIVAACVLYTKAPTEWSAIVNCFAGFIQAFIVVQVLFDKKAKRD